MTKQTEKFGAEKLQQTLFTTHKQYIVLQYHFLSIMFEGEKQRESVYVVFDGCSDV